MEINDEIINELAKDLTSGGLIEAQIHVQELDREVKRIIKEVAEQNPEATREEVLEMANNELTQRMADKTVETTNQENEEVRD